MNTFSLPPLRLRCRWYGIRVARSIGGRNIHVAAAGAACAMPSFVHASLLFSHAGCKHKSVVHAAVYKIKTQTSKHVRYCARAKRVPLALELPRTSCLCNHGQRLTLFACKASTWQFPHGAGTVFWVCGAEGRVSA